MKTKKQVISENPSYKALINAVINNIGMSAVSDVNNYGISGGFSGFIYYDDTVKFANKHRKQIISLLEQDANMLGEDTVLMICNFNYFRKNKPDQEDKRDIYRYLSGTKCKEATIPNLMAWYGAETVCRMFEE